MAHPDADEVLGALAVRIDVLAALASHHRTAAELTADLPVSRSTVDRGLRELERVGFVTSSDGIYRVTLAGWLALDSYDRFVEQLDDIDTASAALEPLEPDAPLDAVFLHGSESVVTNDGDRNPALSRLTSFISEAESIRGCTCGTLPQQVNAYCRRIVEDEIPVDLVVTEDALQRLVTAYRPQLIDVCAIESFSLQLIESLPYGIIVVERPQTPVAILVVYTSGDLHSVVYTDSPAGVAWARQQISDWQETATLLPTRSFTTE